MNKISQIYETTPHWIELTDSEKIEELRLKLNEVIEEMNSRC